MPTLRDIVYRNVRKKPYEKLDRKRGALLRPLVTVVPFLTVNPASARCAKARALRSLGLRGRSAMWLPHRKEPLLHTYPGAGLQFRNARLRPAAVGIARTG